MDALDWVKASINNFIGMQPISKRLLHSKSVMLEQEKERPTSSVRYDRNVEGLKIVLERPWSSLPNDILDLIVDRLGVFEFLNFSSTCKEWHNFASSKAHDHHHHQNSRRQEQLQFLLYGKGEFPNCVLFDLSSKKINKKVNIPELGKSVNCIASDKGWLLLYQESNKSMFFLCPFSRAKIDLPNPPNIFHDSFNWIAAFSSPPTSPDCVVCVCSHIKCDPKTNFGDEARLLVNVLRRGANEEWDNPQVFLLDGHPRHTNSCATFLDGSMYLIDECYEVVSFSLQERQWEIHTMDHALFTLITPKCKLFYVCQGLNKRKLGLKDTDFLTICGTAIHRSGRGMVGDDIMCIYNEEYNSGDPDDGYDAVQFFRNQPLNFHKPALKQTDKKYKGVWLQPQLFYVPPNYKW